jgi:hypothetical protein
MPCSCQIPGPAYPENKEWGPFVWTILHGLAERFGQVVTELYRNDEVRAWQSLLAATGDMLPCSDCRDHFKTWLAAHPVTPILKIPYSELKEWIRNWIWSLHEDVNARLGKPSFPYANLTATYKGMNIKYNFQLLELIEKRAIQQGGVGLVHWQLWVKHYRALTSVYGI